MNHAESYIVFALADTSYAVRSRDVLHIEMMEHVTPVPNSAPWIEGVVFSRGHVVPALNLRARFGLPPESRTPRTRLIFTRHEERTIALIVDSAREFRPIPAEAIRPLGETIIGAPGNFVSGVAMQDRQFVLLLDVPAVLQRSSTELSPVATALVPTA